MSMNIKKIFPITLALLAIVLGGCESSSQDSTTSLRPTDLNTNETDALDLVQDYTNKDFAADGIGEVTLRSLTDGDTARFYFGGAHFPVRFLGINTPESTGKIEPWGKAASDFTADKLTNAEKIVLVNDVALFGERDSSGNRYLGFIWYKPVGGKFRLLNLELVEQAYTENLLFERSTIYNYYDAFRRAGLHAEATGARIYGQDDPSYDYSGQVYDISIRFAREAYNKNVQLRNREGELVFDDNNEPVMVKLSDSMKIRLRAVVIGNIANNLMLRDVYDPDEDGHYASIYLFTQYRDAAYNDVGDVIEIYCKVTTFLENVQLTDPGLNTFDKKAPLKLITYEGDAKYDEKIAQYGMVVNYEPIDFTTKEISKSSDFAPYNGLFIKVHVKIRIVTNHAGEDADLVGVTTGPHWRKDANRNLTIYAHFAGTTVPFNIRLDGGLFPYVDYDWFVANETYEVCGYLAPYYENFQIQLFNDAEVIPVT